MLGLPKWFAFTFLMFAFFSVEDVFHLCVTIVLSSLIIVDWSHHFH